MSKVYSIYDEKNGLDKAWFESSNVRYAECDDKDGELKTVRVVFNNGSQYQYKDVNVYDYLKFREDDSQGKAFNKYLRKYEFEKLENADLNKIAKELDEATKVTPWTVMFGDSDITIKDEDGDIVCKVPCNANDEFKSALMTILENIDRTVGRKWKTENKEG